MKMSTLLDLQNPGLPVQLAANEVRLLKAIARMNKTRHLNGILAGIETKSNLNTNELNILVVDLAKKGLIVKDEDLGAKITTEGRNWLRILNKATASDRKIAKKLDSINIKLL